MKNRPLEAWLLPLSALFAAVGCSTDTDPSNPSWSYEVAFSSPQNEESRIGEEARVFVELIQHGTEHCEESLTGEMRCTDPSSGPVNDFEIVSAGCSDATCEVLEQSGALEWMWEIRFVPNADAGSLSVVAKEPSRGEEVSGVFRFDAER